MAKVEVIGKITNRQVIAAGNKIKELGRLRKQYGSGHWRKYKGRATVQDPDGTMWKAEVHWYQAHSVGVFEMKVKKYLDRSD